MPPSLPAVAALPTATPPRSDAMAAASPDRRTVVAEARLPGLDRLRTGLTVLVIAHHAAITYGASGGWFLREVDAPQAPASLVLTMLCAVDQAFFMGLFFLLAGLFTPGALARKGLARFALDRALRLAVPLLVFGLVLGPLTVAIAGAASRPDPVAIAARWLALVAQGRFVPGPLWFAWALLLFTAGWVAWDRWARRAGRAAGSVPGAWPSHRAWLAAALGLGAAAFAVRLVVPVGQTVAAVQLGYVAGYLFWFALGCALGRGGVPVLPDRAAVRPWRVVTGVALPVLPIAALGLPALTGHPGHPEGGPDLGAAVYAAWEPFVAIGLVGTLLARACTRPARRPGLAWVDGAAYAAFVLHAPVLVAVSVALRPWDAPALAKFAVATGLAAGLSFVLGAAVRRLPGARRIL